MHYAAVKANALFLGTRWKNVLTTPRWAGKLTNFQIHNDTRASVLLPDELERPKSGRIFQDRVPAYSRDNQHLGRDNTIGTHSSSSNRAYFGRNYHL